MARYYFESHDSCPFYNEGLVSYILFADFFFLVLLASNSLLSFGSLEALTEPTRLGQ